MPDIYIKISFASRHAIAPLLLAYVGRADMGVLVSFWDGTRKFLYR